LTVVKAVSARVRAVEASARERPSANPQPWTQGQPATRFAQPKGSKVLVLVKNLGTQISAIEGMIKSVCFVGARWSWHRDLPGTVAEPDVYQSLGQNNKTCPL